MLKSVDCLISVGGGKEAIKLTHKSFSYDEWTFFSLSVVIILSVTQ